MRQLGKSVQFEPLPSFVLRVFDKRVRGQNTAGPSSDPDLSGVDQKLLSSLLTFQREGVMYRNFLLYFFFLNFNYLGFVAIDFQIYNFYYQ